MLNKGTVIKLTHSKALVLSPDEGFVQIKRSPLMEVGRMVFYDSSDIIKNTKNSRLGIVGGIAAAAVIIFIVSFMYMQFYSVNRDYAYLDMDTNPSIRFTIDNSYKVSEITPINEDAQSITKDLRLEGVAMDKAFSKVLEEIRGMGLWNGKSRDSIIVSMAMNESVQEFEKDKQAYKSRVEAIVRNIKLAVKDKPEVKGIRFIMVSPWEKAKADSLKVSMNRYVVFKRALEKGKKLDVNQLRNKSVVSLLAENNIKLDDIEIALPDMNAPAHKTPEKMPEKTSSLPAVDTNTVQPTKKPNVARTPKPPPVTEPVSGFAADMVKPSPTNTPLPLENPTPPTPPADQGGIREWKWVVEYKEGDVVSYKGVLYVCIQAHKSTSMWDPPYVPALWKKKK
ncbi:MAG: hypothetical protein N2645_13760 [Clostridia bacterium]|nr:hypothetical protein [Clostridia bacterium]